MLIILSLRGGFYDKSILGYFMENDEVDFGDSSHSPTRVFSIKQEFMETHHNSQAYIQANINLLS